MSRTTCRTCRQPVALSPREEDVLRALANGASSSEAAKSLFIADTTFGVHIRHIADLLGIEGPSNRTRVLIAAAEHGLVPPDTQLGRVLVRQLWAELPTEVLF